MVSWDAEIAQKVNENSDYSLYLFTPLLGSGLNEPSWSPELVVTKAIGLPLRIMPFAVSFCTTNNDTLNILGKMHLPGDFIFRRSDAKDLKVEEVKAIEAYVKAMAEPNLSTEGFKAFFTTYSMQMGWQNVPCPI